MQEQVQEMRLAPHRGGLILTLGILGLVVCAFLGIAAWVMGSADLREMAEGRMDPAGRDMTNAGKICGMIATCLLILGGVGMILVLALGLGAATMK
jgi:hypothetical protein